jgi:hypothetical protein
VLNPALVPHQSPSSVLRSGNPYLGDWCGRARISGAALRTVI